MLTTALIAIAVLAELSTSMGAYRHTRYEISRSDILQVGRQFMERLRSDEDPETLYERLRDLMQQAGLSPGAGPKLADGRSTYLPQTYYPDFVHPAALRELGVLVDVPAALPEAPPTNDPSGTPPGYIPGPPVLREDLDAPSFGLPADLNADGVVDADPRDEDHAALPVIVTLRWGPSGEDLEEVRLRTWLRIPR